MIASLGDDGSCDAAIETLMQIRVKEALRTSNGEWPKDLAEVPPHWATKPIPSADNPVWADIGALFDRDWFRRAWIVQEVVAATSVRILCGKWIMDWNDLFNATEVITREAPRSPSGPLALAQSKWTKFLTLANQRKLEARQHRLSLMELLERFRYTKSTKEQDRFFCLLGLATDGNEEGFVLDYGTSFDAVVAGAFIRQGKVMELLHRAGINSRPEAQFPSWIPDWTVPKQESLRTLAKGMPCAASMVAEPRFEFDSGSDEFELRVHGIRVDTIISVQVRYLDCGVSAGGGQDCLRKRRVSKRAQHYKTGEVLPPPPDMSGRLDHFEPTLQG